MIKPKHAPWVFSILMSTYMVFIMTFVITWVNTGLGGNFGARWLNAFTVAWPVAFLLVIVGGSRIRQFVESLVRKPQA